MTDTGGHEWSDQAGGCSCGWLTDDADAWPAHLYAEGYEDGYGDGHADGREAALTEPEWEPDEDATPVVDVPTGRYL